MKWLLNGQRGYQKHDILLLVRLSLRQAKIVFERGIDISLAKAIWGGVPTSALTREIHPWFQQFSRPIQS